MTIPCTLCRAYGPTMPAAGGRLELCSLCTLSPLSCVEVPHAWHGVELQGHTGEWVCWTCGAVLAPTPLTTGRVEVPTQMQPWDC
jgi:hypothetical protein